MDFGEILDKWEKQTVKTGGRNQALSRASSEMENRADASHPLSLWLDQNGTYDKDSEDLQAAANRNNRGRQRYIMLRKKPDARIDLHGCNMEEAWTALEAFFEDSRKKRFQKVLVIHGKGNHRSTVSGDLAAGGVLKDITRRFIERCSFAGESGYSHARDGGMGATWVILKESKES